RFGSQVPWYSAAAHACESIRPWTHGMVWFCTSPSTMILSGVVCGCRWLAAIPSCLPAVYAARAWELALDLVSQPEAAPKTTPPYTITQIHPVHRFITVRKAV